MLTKLIAFFQVSLYNMSVSPVRRWATHALSTHNAWTLFQPNEARRTTILVSGTLAFPSIIGSIFTAMVNVEWDSCVFFPVLIRKELPCYLLPRQKYFKQPNVIKLVYKVRSHRKEFNIFWSLKTFYFNIKYIFKLWEETPYSKLWPLDPVSFILHEKSLSYNYHCQVCYISFLTMATK